MSRMIALLLMLILPLQALAAAQRQLAHAAGFPPDHMAAHAEHIPHHHDEDGEIAFDDSTASASHQLDFDYGTHFQAPLPAGMVPPLTLQMQGEPLFLGGRIPDPGCSPPLRPPHAPA
ncbi:conserved exported hypothetical protein [Cupriavidus taiwanensis]|uniref:Uncharacterized protein n=2 Tax=Cupriavidus taiwanensis TaxID=164546 RepID=A0A375J766_9BURK|nr:conserved exported hypothetical protein [Cupriavidus taiwanensis]